MRSFGIRAIALAGLMLGISLSISGKSDAAKDRFSCRWDKNGWATVVNSAEGKVPLIYWTSGDFAETGWTNKTRCQTVSERFRQYDASGQLKLLKAGMLNRYPVLCAVRNRDEHCTKNNLLVTLKPEKNAKDTLEKLLDIRRRVSSGRPIYLNDEVVIYQGDAMMVDMDKFLDVFLSAAVRRDSANSSPSQP